MDRLLLLAAKNTVVAFVLGLLVFALTRLWRNPPAAHALWLLVLLRLVAPPIAYLDWPLTAPSGAMAAHPSNKNGADMARRKALDAGGDTVRPGDGPADRTTMLEPARVNDDMASFWSPGVSGTRRGLCSSRSGSAARRSAC